MKTLFQIDWESVFIPSLHIGEIVLRGTIVYLFLFVLLRILRRGAGAIGISDLLVLVLVADAAQNAMASEYKSITEGLVLVTTIVLWDYLLDWLGYRFPGLRPLLRPAPSLLIKNGRVQRRNLAREMITEEELVEQLREQGVASIEEVKESFMEGDGHISVITKDSKKPRKRQSTLS
ncbi:MAG: YetF domain-containing protein [Candidatus Binatia bacterium]